MKKYFVLFLFCLPFFVKAQTKEEEAVRSLLQTQTDCWNRGDIRGFMQTYWQDDSLLFIGKNGITRGWQQTLDHYTETYPDAAAMGQLRFEIIEVKRLSVLYFHVVGRWMLTRSGGDLSGYYNLLVKKIKGKWRIVADHSS